MMLDDLFSYRTFEPSDDGAHALVELNPQAALFAGHFPAKSVLPGVAQQFIVRSVAQRKLGRALYCTSVREVKFLSPVLPAEDYVLEVDMSLTPKEKSWAAQATIRSGESLKMKFRATFE